MRATVDAAKLQRLMQEIGRRAVFEDVAPRLVRYPSVDAQALAARVEKLLGELT